MYRNDIMGSTVLESVYKLKIIAAGHISASEVLQRGGVPKAAGGT